VTAQAYRIGSSLAPPRYVCGDCLPLLVEPREATALTEDDVVFITEGRDSLFCDECSDPCVGADPSP
jgi:hypothetical protein